MTALAVIVADSEDAEHAADLCGGILLNTDRCDYAIVSHRRAECSRFHMDNAAFVYPFFPWELKLFDAALVVAKERMNSHYFWHAGVYGALARFGVPFASSNIAPARDMWRKGIGYLVSNEPESWATALNLLLDPEYEGARADMRTAGLQWAGT